MKTKFVLLFLLSFLMSACSNASSTQTTAVLSITDGVNAKTYTLADVQVLEQRSVDDKDVAYVGISLSVLLREAGFNPEAITELQAIASDGFSATYTPEMIAQPDIILAYARSDAPLTAEEAPFRMVALGLGGKLNPRMVVELRVTQP